MMVGHKGPYFYKNEMSKTIEDDQIPTVDDVHIDNIVLMVGL
jgi:hypothetical protein